MSKSSAPDISVIVTTYNRKKLLAETVNSILAQTYSNYEIIIIDNYSDYDFFAFIKTFNDSRICAFQNANNGVIAINRNYGIKKASGNFIAFCDDDDLWVPEKLALQKLFFTQNPDTYLVYTAYRTFSNESNISSVYPKPKNIITGYSKKNIVKYILRPSIGLSTVMIKMQVVEKVGLFSENPKYFAVEDSEYFARVIKKFKIGYVENPLMKYRLHNNVSNVSIKSELKRVSNLRYEYIDDIGIARYLYSQFNHALFLLLKK